MARFYTYLLSCALLLGMGACSDDSIEEPLPGQMIDARFGSTYIQTSDCPQLMSRSVLEQSVAARPPQAMHNTGKIYLKDQYVYVNERFEGVHVIDNQDPKNPRIVSFLRIPGNVDIAIKGNLLYADNGPDLVTIDISNPMAVRITSRVRDAFRELPMPEPLPLHSDCAATNRPDNTVVVGWQKKMDTVAVGSNPMWDFGFRNTASNGSGPAFFSAPSAGSTGKAGSLARFAILDNTLYSVDEQSLRLFSLTTPTTPTPGPKVNLQLGVETIFPKDHYLFLGTQRGMYIFDVAIPQSPRQVSYYEHVVSCDPVVVDDRYAYVTLRSGRFCGGGPNQLQVIDLTNLSKPVLAQRYPMTGPQGLGVDINQLFVCDFDGLKTFDTSKAPLLTQKQHFNVSVTDVIPNGGNLLAIGSEGLYQYSYAGAQLQQLSLLPITPKP